MRLGVNVDHIATLREARKGFELKDFLMPFAPTWSQSAQQNPFSSAFASLGFKALFIRRLRK